MVQCHISNCLRKTFSLSSLITGLDWKLFRFPFSCFNSVYLLPRVKERDVSNTAQVLCRFKGYYNVSCGTENIFCDITYFPRKCALFVAHFVFLVYKNADVDNFFSKSLRRMAKLFMQI